MVTDVDKELNHQTGSFRREKHGSRRKYRQDKFKPYQYVGIESETSSH